MFRNYDSEAQLLQLAVFLFICFFFFLAKDEHINTLIQITPRLQNMKTVIEELKQISRK